MVGAQALALAALMSWLTAKVPTVDDALLNTGSGRAYFREVFSAGGWGLIESERAAFIVVRDDGSSACLMWPASHLFHVESYRGAMPAGTFAIVHTHPNALPMPSQQDRDQAEQLGIPIYVVTAQTIYKTERGRTTRVAPASWYALTRSADSSTRCQRLQ